MEKSNIFKNPIKGFRFDVIQLLVDEKKMSINEAMDFFYNSKTFGLLMNPETGLYYQSPVYVFDILGNLG